MNEPQVDQKDDSGNAHVAPAARTSAGEERSALFSGSGRPRSGVGPRIELYQLLVESVRDYAIFALDPGGVILSWNAGAARIKGYAAEEIVGRHFSTFYTAEDLAAGKPDMELAVAGREGRIEDEGWRIRKDGSRFWASVVITALFGEHGDLIGYAKVTRDLTERRLAQQREVDDARRLAEVEASSRAKSGFLAAMSHELRTPLNAIAGYAQLMQDGVGGDVSGQHRDYLTRIRSSQQHLLGIVNDLLNYSRMEAGGIVYERELVAAHEVVDEVLAMVAPQLERKRLRLRRGTCAPDVAAIADRLKVEQVVLNLLSNAVKFTPEEGTITVDCGRDEQWVTISVRDTGPGIPSDKLEVIFDPFVQLGRTLTSMHEGAGLGLAISRDLARAMNGDVRVESVEGEGATFTLSLPVVSPTER